jgi:hypothetical protein
LNQTSDAYLLLGITIYFVFIGKFFVGQSDKSTFLSEATQFLDTVNVLTSAKASLYEALAQ